MGDGRKLEYGLLVLLDIPIVIFLGFGNVYLVSLIKMNNLRRKPSNIELIILL